MAISIKDVEYVAKLAKLEFSAEEMKTFTQQLDKILVYMEKLNELDTTNVEPLSHVNESNNVFRDDIVLPSLQADEALRNAPSKNDSFFKVPNVLGKSK
jgi:aspartyl-tRNA(Asn)/glutamyl-tRNA(Gln) amidotransferase subunit C